MANPIRPNGFSPVKTVQGNAWTEQAPVYFVPQTDTTAIYIGDLVKTVAGGDPNGIPAVTKCNSGDTPRGIVVGVLVTPPVTNPSLQGAALSLETTYAPATKTKGYYLLVVDDPYVCFEIMDDGLSCPYRDGLQQKRELYGRTSDRHFATIGHGPYDLVCCNDQHSSHQVDGPSYRSG